MLLEDHADSRELLVHALRAAGAAVAAFGAAKDAFAALDDVRPSVIVADVGLPDEDGYSFMERVRSCAPRDIQSVPAIAVTAYATAADQAKARISGFQEHLPKPIEPEHLVQMIYELTRRST